MVTENEYDAYFRQYIKLVNLEESIIKNLENSQTYFYDLLNGLSEEKYNYRYGQGKWTIQEVVQHIIDTERIFAYRTLSFARKDNTPLPGFDQDFFTKHSNANSRNFKDLLEEMTLLRKGTILLFKSLSEEDLLESGVMSSMKISVRALGYLFSGHQMHHLNVIKEKYLQ